MKKLLTLLIFTWCLALPVPASAQCSGQFQANTVCGNNGTTPSLPFQIPSPGLPGGVLTNTLNSQTSNYTVLSTDCGKTIQAGTGSTGFFTVTIPSVSGFAATCVVSVYNGDTGRAKRIANDPGCDPVFHFLWPGQACTFGIVNGAWVALNTPGRWGLGGAVTFHADSTNGTDNNSTDCLGTGAAACATITHAASIVCDELSLNGQQVAIAPPSGVPQVENVSLCNYTPGHGAATTLNPEILGNTSAPNTYSIAPASGNVITGVNVSTPWTINGVSLGGSGVSICIEADINSFIYVANTIFNTCGIGIQGLYGGKVEFIGPNTLTGPFSAAFTDIEYGAQFLTQTYTITCSTGFAVGVFAQSLYNAVQQWAQATFSGCSGVTGIRYAAIFGGGINTGGGGATFLPGSTLSGGGATSPGWYN